MQYSPAAVSQPLCCLQLPPSTVSTHAASPHRTKITVTLKDVRIFYSFKVTNSTSRRAEVVVPDPSVIRVREVNLKMLE